MTVSKTLIVTILVATWSSNSSHRVSASKSINSLAAKTESTRRTSSYLSTLPSSLSSLQLVASLRNSKSMSGELESIDWKSRRFTKRMLRKWEDSQGLHLRLPARWIEILNQLPISEATEKIITTSLNSLFTLRSKREMIILPQWFCSPLRQVQLDLIRHVARCLLRWKHRDREPSDWLYIFELDIE